MTTTPREFVHLHIHSEYSLLDGSILLKKLIKELIKRGATAAALTDHDSMHGAIEYYLACKKDNIHPILGFEVNLECQTRSLDGQMSHLTLLAENNAGMRNLVKICTIANTEGINRHGEGSTSVTWADLEKHAEGIICLTGCLKGEVPTLLAKEQRDAAAAHLDRLVALFGANNVFVEIWDNNLPAQRMVVPRLIELARAKNVPLVATADVHYLKPEDQRTHLSLLAIKHKLQDSALREVDTSYQFHLATAEEMWQKFGEYPDALENTVAIAKRCKVDIDTKSIFMPDYRIRPDETSDECLVRLAKEGLEERKTDIMAWMGDKFTPEVWEDYQKRLDYEISVILKMKFSGYFLIVQDFINWAIRNGIPVGPGRGSAAGSIVTYALRITNIDPIRFNLLFERFLNPERISMPDIDTDFCMDRRGEVLEYVYEKYGRRAVSQIVTFGRMKAKNAVKALARISGWSYTDSNNLAKLIPDGPNVTLESAVEEQPALKELLQKDERTRTVWEGALAIEGVLDHLGIHAAGVIISDSALDERCPIMETQGQLLTQYEHKYAEKIGLIKFDFLGLKTLTVIQRAVDLVRARHVPDFNIDRIDLEDPQVYKMISTAHVTGVFQLESAGMRKLISDMQPSCFTDIIAILALFRPGPLKSGFVEEFVLRKHGEKEVSYLFPELEPILRDTYGAIVYQEQVQKIAAVLANYSLGEADLLRRAMGKKDAAEMSRQKVRFLEGAKANNHDLVKAEELFDMMAKFAEYGFNKSHTAAYGYVCYQTAYLKTYYPTEFMAAILTCDLDDTDKVVNYVRDCRRMGIRILPPSVNHSSFEFTIPAAKTIRFGLGAIKGLGKTISELIVDERKKNGPFDSVADFIARVSLEDTRRLNKKTMESLIKAGAFDEIASNRAEILANIDNWLRSITREIERGQATTGGLFDFAPVAKKPPKAPDSLQAAAGKSPTDKKQVRNEYEPYRLTTRVSTQIDSIQQYIVGAQVKPTPAWSQRTQLANEFAALGFYVSAHPADIILDDLRAAASTPLVNVPSLLAASSGERDFRSRQQNTVRLAGIVSAVFEKLTKDNEQFCIYKLEDGTGEIEVSVFPKLYATLEERYARGDAIWAECRLSRGAESGSVRAQCVRLGRISEFREDNIQQVILEIDEAFAKQGKDLNNLIDMIKSNPGDTPVVVDVKVPTEKARVRFHLAKTPVLACDDLIHGVEETWPGLVKVHRSYRPEIRIADNLG